jgi:predicted RNA binding protein YcfA (HicA-like mRNA interferase family)
MAKLPVLSGAQVIQLHKELAPGTLTSILRQADLSIEELINKK